MAHLTGYKLFHDYGKDGVGENDGISGGQETFVIFTDEDLPLGSGTVTYGTSLGEVSGVFYEYSGDTYFVPDDDTGFPVDENGVVTSFTEAIRGTRKDDTVNGTGDDDVIYDTDQHPYNPTGSDRIHAGAGDDTIVFGNGNDTILGEGGDDHIGSWSFGDGNNLIDAGDGNDTVIGGYGDDQIIGGAGDDWLAGSGGRDTIDGGDGHDEIVVYDNGDYASVLGGEGARDWDTLNLQTYDTTSGVEVNFTGNEAGTFAFNGSSTYGDFREIEEVSATEYDDRIDASADNAGVVIKAGGGDDVATGGSGNDHISGGTGNDSISGGAGADTLTGGAGVDTLSGGDGNDVFQIGESHEITDIQGEGWWDTIEFDDEGSGEGAIVTYGGDSFGSYTLGSASGDFLSVEQTETTQNSDLVDASASNDSVVTSMLDGNDTFLGGGGDDRAWLGQGEDSVIAGAGDDEIHGEAGSDTIWGGEGNDQLYGGEGSDVFGFADGDGFDV
ncbi:hemolysin type calcium-binding protein, partial [Shimia isoporae]